jgi:metal-responsive CopG/Arc/MetJ family transcriptional regulator
MATKTRTIGVCFQPDVYDALEKMRDGRTRVRSAFINQAIREKLGIKPGAV